MKKKLIYMFFLLLSVIGLMAQESKMYGDWQGYYDTKEPNENWEMVPVHMKMYVRIKSQGGKLSVRVKNYPMENPSKITYWNNCNITRQTSTSISFSSLINTVNERWNDTESERVNGKVVFKYSVYYDSYAYLEEGTLNLTYHLRYVYYGRDDEVIGYSDGIADNVTLYQEEDDW